MNVQLLPTALDDVAFLRACGFRGRGLLLGSAVGRCALVERLLPVGFAAGDGGEAAGVGAAVYGERLLGAFTCRCRPRAADWLAGLLVLAVSAGELRPFACGFDRARRRARLLPLAEETGTGGEAWPS